MTLYMTGEKKDVLVVAGAGSISYGSWLAWPLAGFIMAAFSQSRSRSCFS
jgi:hypothetical protein